MQIQELASVCAARCAGKTVHERTDLIAETLQSLLSASKPAAQTSQDSRFLHLCSEELIRGTLTSLPLKAEFAKERGMTIEQVEEWMRGTRRMFRHAVGSRLAASPAAPAQSGETREQMRERLSRKILSWPENPNELIGPAVVLDDERAAFGEAFGEAFRINFTYPNNSEVHPFRKGWEAGIMYARAASPQPVAQPVEKTAPSDSEIEAMCAEHGLGPNVGKLVVNDALKRWGRPVAQPVEQTAPYLPCPICKGVEGCDHTVPERKRATENTMIQLNFGFGELVVQAVKVDKFEFPGIVIFPAAQPGIVGNSAKREPDIGESPDLLEQSILLCFPTEEQRNRVEDALVNARTQPVEQTAQSSPVDLKEARKSYLAGYGNVGNTRLHVVNGWDAAVRAMSVAQPVEQQQQTRALTSEQREALEFARRVIDKHHAGSGWAAREIETILTAARPASGGDRE